MRGVIGLGPTPASWIACASGVAENEAPCRVMVKRCRTVMGLSAGTV